MENTPEMKQNSNETKGCTKEETQNSNMNFFPQVVYSKKCM